MAGVDLSSCAPCAGLYGVAAAGPEAGLPPAVAPAGMSVDGEAIREACEAALSDVRPRPADEVEQLGVDLEGHVRLLAPTVAARVPTMDESMRAVGLLVLGHADKALAPALLGADRPGRLHDLGAVARALLALVEMTDGPKSEDESEPADATGWLVVLRPE
ncbi:DUF6415 family natural product biosynthesis protein [Streptomyces chartreusis]|uniref:DUF6415 family natural product biosynthesis protein n=1 Tax=Streptomyces chartreusis TaxID=1969 RepID=UPI00167A61DF|nr:DUF6415 family natural product biosynthesis protein [Streptomyces chartreusis]